MSFASEKAESNFKEIFGGQPEIVVQAPGRVNLLGEHTDYNEGFVFPMAINRWVAFALRRTTGYTAMIRSVEYGEEVKFETNQALKPSGTWIDYPKGMVKEFQALGLSVGGFEGVLAGDVPVGAGLSSSAAVEMAVGKGILGLNHFPMSGTELAHLSQRAENQFVGVHCGIMDQFISANAQAGHALFLDCRDLSFEHVPFPKGWFRIVICNSGVKRGLDNSAYNDRRRACEQGVQKLSVATGKEIQSLRDVDRQFLEFHRNALPDLVFRRCLHVVTENERTCMGVGLLKRRKLKEFGALMDHSHISLRDYYEVSSPELDLLVEIARNVSGVLGSRMTGAGFGGCTVNLVEDSAVEGVEMEVKASYRNETGRIPEVYVCSPVNGAEKIS